MISRRNTLIHPRHVVGSTPPPDFIAGRVVRREGKPLPTYSKVIRQTYRVADDDVANFELYVGEDAMPDFDAVGQPVATSATLPITWTPTPPGAGTLKLYCVTRQRNKYNMLSFNQHPTIVEIDTAGDEVLGPLSTPEIEKVFDRAVGEIVVNARYPYGVDRNEADTWSLYVKTGSAPVPGVDSPVATESFGKAWSDYFWRISEDGLAANTLHYIVVTVSRDGDPSGVIGESDVTQHTTAATPNIDSELATLFGGSQYEKGN